MFNNMKRCISKGKIAYSHLPLKYWIVIYVIYWYFVQLNY